ncbi:MAG: bifunctional fucokinase/L-fucose-1-P-guanylyltransferase, partial [Prevotella sp.]|nr:bifunctional fucokinase/L-fucose-1-P-guanylyltransferase [Prevotella sp.]
MKKLLSLPPNLVDSFHAVTQLSPQEYFCTCDPVGHRLGSGGGTSWLLASCFENEEFFAEQSGKAERRMKNEEFAAAEVGTSVENSSFFILHSSFFIKWLSREKRILLHAGGQSRRLPSYAPSGKILTPVPVFRWERGQRLSQDLLSLQLPLYERIMNAAPERLHTMVVSGDVLILADAKLPPVPDADVVCYGLWLPASVAKNHGVFVSDRRTPHVLKQMLQKPTPETLSALQRQHFYLTDIGVWLLSDRAVEVLMKKSLTPDPSRGGEGSEMLEGERLSAIDFHEYDLYSEFGCALGTDPTIDDAELRELSVAIVPLPGGEFYHFGTSREMISSTLAVQNRVNDQRQIMHNDRKPHPSIFVQNAVLHNKLTADNSNIWIENSWVGAHWTLTSDNIVTGVPRNDWHVTLRPGECMDVVPIGEQQYCLRRYHIDDRFAGSEQQKKQFLVVDSLEELEFLASLDNLDSLDSLDNLDSLANLANIEKAPELLSAEDISTQANLHRLFEQRRSFRNINWPAIAANWEYSVFYQLDLDDAARQFADNLLPLPAPLPDTAPLMTRISDAMFRGDSERAFRLLRESLTPDSLTPDPSRGGEGSKYIDASNILLPSPPRE